MNRGVTVFNRIAEIYAYRTMIGSLVKRDLKGRYLGSVLGVLWNFLNPLFQLIIYSLVFSKIMRAGIEDYYMFLFVAIIPWIFFSSCITGGTGCLLEQKEMVKKIYFPREVLPISYVTAQFINMLMCFVVVFAVMFIFRYTFNFSALCTLPIIMIVEYVLALGFTMISSAFAVYFRDLQHIMGILAMAWQFMTPVMYDTTMIPEEFVRLFYLNPMTYVIEAYRSVLYYGQVPDLRKLMIVVFIGATLLLVGWFTFNKVQRHFIEEL